MQLECVLYVSSYAPQLVMTANHSSKPSCLLCFQNTYHLAIDYNALAPTRGVSLALRYTYPSLP